MTFYDEDLIKSIMQFDELLADDWFAELAKIPNHSELLSAMIWKIHNLQYAVRVLYVVIKNEMRETNRIRDLLTKLPNTDEFRALQNELEAQKKNTTETLLPIKKLAEALEESKNKRVDYIG